MKSVIVYQSKKGCTEKCATFVKEQNNIEEMYHISAFDKNRLDYDHVIIMTPVYIGQIDKQIKAFINNHNETLLNKKLTIVVVGMNIKEYDKMLELNFSEDLRNHAEIIYGGGAYYFEKLNFLQKMIIKKVAQVSSTKEEINYSNLQKIKI